MHITPAKLSSFIDKPLHEVKSIDLSNKEITHLDDISCCVQLNRLDLSKNGLNSTGQLVGIQYCAGLTFLKLTHNELEGVQFVEKLTNLITLNLGNNKISRISHHIASCSKLKALVLNNNNLSSLDNLESLTELNSLILSHNQFKDPPKISCFTHLTKLTLSYNQLKEFPTLTSLSELKELNLNANKIVNIPSELKYCSALSILNIGNNLIANFESIQILSQLLKLHDLTLQGNPISKLEDYTSKVKSCIPGLRILDGNRFDPKFLERKERMKRNLETEKADVPDSQVQSDNNKPKHFKKDKNNDHPKKFDNKQHLNKKKPQHFSKPAGKGQNQDPSTSGSTRENFHAKPKKHFQGKKNGDKPPPKFNNDKNHKK